MSTLEEKLVDRQNKKELKEAFPSYNELKTLHKGSKNLMCKIFGHKRHVHHAFFVETTDRGKEYYECYICERCKDILGKLVRITKKSEL